MFAFKLILRIKTFADMAFRHGYTPFSFNICVNKNESTA